MHEKNLNSKLRDLLTGSESRASRTFALFIQILIVLSMITFAIETLPGLSQASRNWLFRFETFTVLVFSVEYLGRLLYADNRLQFVFSFFGIIDLLAILPFYLALGIDLRAIRAFRLLRLFRILKLGRYSAAARRFHTTLLLAREELILYLAATSVIMFLAATGIYYFERDTQPQAFASVFHSLWWAVVTLTTVGYGDTYPVTVGGRAFTLLVLLAGLGVVSVPAGLMSSALSRARQIELDATVNLSDNKEGNVADLESG
jgi:voltage-gated potassium channel